MGVSVLLQESGDDVDALAALYLWERTINAASAKGTGAAGYLPFKVAMTVVRPSQIGYGTALNRFQREVRDMADTADVLFVPSQVLAAKAVIDSLPGTGRPIEDVPPIMVWGTAADSVFSQNCAPTAADSVGKPCFGTFTLGSQYMEEGLRSINEINTQVIKTVSLVQNTRAFSGV